MAVWSSWERRSLFGRAIESVVVVPVLTLSFVYLDFLWIDVPVYGFEEVHFLAAVLNPRGCLVVLCLRGTIG